MNAFRNLGPTLQIVRTMQGFNMAELAERAGVPARSLSQFERGLKLPSLDTLDKLLGALNLPPSAFFITMDFARDISLQDALSVAKERARRAEASSQGAGEGEA